MNVGDEINLKAVSNPSTGYGWIVDTDILRGLIDVSDSFTTNTPPDSKEGKTLKPRLGMGGYKIFTLKALAPGQVRFRAVYARSWEFDGFDNQSDKIPRSVDFEINV